MKVLFVIPYAPTRIRTRPYHFLYGLVGAGHSVTLATLWQTPAERDALAALAEDGIDIQAERLTRAQSLANVAGALVSRSPLQATYAWQPAIAARLVTLVQNAGFDVAHVEHLRGARYALALRTRLPTVWDSVDCISYLFEQARQRSLSWRGRFMTALELGRTRRYEGRLVGRFARVLVTSHVDKSALDSLAGLTGQASPVRIVPNGVSVDELAAAAQPRQHDTIVLSGKMSYHANVTAALYFAREILPLIWAERPAARLWIVGQSPPSAITRLATDTRITVTGAVPEMSTYLAQAAVAVCPTVYGAGVQNKVLEAMACATPVVSSAQGLVALGARDGVDVLSADSPAAFAEAVLRVLSDDLLARRIGEAGCAYVKRAHDWRQSIVALERAYQDVRAANPGRAASAQRADS